MIGEKFSYNGKEYEIKKDITFGEYRRINRVTTSLGTLANKYGEDDIAKLDTRQQTQIVQEFSETSEKQMELMVEFLEQTLGLSQEDLDNMTLEEASGLFNETFKNTTQVKKNSSQTSGSPYS